MALKVITPAGATICGHGSREFGEAFEGLTEEHERYLAKSCPDRFSLIGTEAAGDKGKTKEGTRPKGGA